MTEMQSSVDDYTSGRPRKHHSLYLEDGTLVMQVENAIFKVHRSFLVSYSAVMQGLIDLPNEGGSKDGIEENSLVLAGDSAAAWELLLEFQCTPRIKSESPTRDQLLQILPIAHKYCMESIESEIIEELKQTSQYDGFIDLIVASRMVDSNELYQDGIRRLIASQVPLNLEQARRMGLEATQAVTTEIINALKKALEATKIKTTASLFAGFGNSKPKPPEPADSSSESASESSD